jgi:phage major head subunit gpT-like protein
MMIRTQYPDLFLASMLPAINASVMKRFQRDAPVYSQVFRVETSSRSIEQHSEITGLGNMVEIPEGGDMRYDYSVPGFDKTFVHSQFGLGFKASRLLADDDRFGIIKKLSSELGRSAAETIELAAVSDFNNGFTAGSTAGPDGVALFSTAHPMVKSGATQANTLSSAADLDIASLELALTDFRLMKDPAGKMIRLEPKQLIIPAQQEFAAAEMLKGTMRSDTANNTINAFKNRIGMESFDSILVWKYLSDADAWFIRADKEDIDLIFYWRERFNVVHEVHFDSRTIKTASWMRFSHGWSNWYGLYGVPGV